MGRRLLRLLVIVLVLLLLGGLWAFSFFLFNPFEGKYEYAIASLIPREVDFYASKNELRRDFDPFPRLAFMDELEASPEGQALLDLGLREELRASGMEEALAQLEEVLAQLPVRIDPLGLFGGRALALAGHFSGPRFADAQWAVYGRTGWIGKLAVELVSGDWVDLSAQGLSVKPVEDEGERIGVELSGGQLARPILLGRIRDVVIVASDGGMLSAARAFERSRGQDSFGQSAKYADNIGRKERAGNELEVYLDQRAMSENMKLAGNWPDARSKDVATALLGRLFQIGAVRELIGTTDFARAVTFDLVGELSSNALTPFQNRLYDERGFDKDQMLEVARLVPSDAGLLAYLHGDVGDLLRELRSVIQGIDPAAIENLEDFVRAAWSYPDLDPLIEDLSAALRDRVAFFVRDYDYPPEVGELVPPHDDTPVYAWALVLWPQDQKRLDDIRDVIKRQDVQDMLKIQGAEPGSRGLYENTLQGGAKVNEYWNVLVPGTGHIATLEMKGREPYLVITNENRLCGQIFTMYLREVSDEGLTPLSKDSAFMTWVQSGLPSANFLAWVAPGAVAETTARVADRQAARTGADYIDWSIERPRIEREVLAKHFPGEKWGDVSDANRDSFDMLVQQEVDRFEQSYLQEHLPKLRAESRQRLLAAQAIDGAILQLSTDRKRLHLLARVALGFEP